MRLLSAAASVYSSWLWGWRVFAAGPPEFGKADVDNINKMLQDTPRRTTQRTR